MKAWETSTWNYLQSSRDGLISISLWIKASRCFSSTNTSAKTRMVPHSCRWSYVTKRNFILGVDMRLLSRIRFYLIHLSMLGRLSLYFSTFSIIYDRSSLDKILRLDFKASSRINNSLKNVIFDLQESISMITWCTQIGLFILFLIWKVNLRGEG